jgi:glutamate dehydrogenase (NADP+)
MWPSTRSEKIIELGGKVLTMSDSSGYIFDEEGIDRRQAGLHQTPQKHQARAASRSMWTNTPRPATRKPTGSLDHNPLWDHKADCAFPCAAENEINEKDAANLVKNGVKLVCEGADMPVDARGYRYFWTANLSMRPARPPTPAVWPFPAGNGPEPHAPQLVRRRGGQRLKTVMKNIHLQCLETATEYGRPGNYVMGAKVFYRRIQRGWSMPCSS